MKLRNKKTGKIIEYSIGLNQWSEDDKEWFLFGNYDSIDELKEDWEDYKPAEPLIKDEKIRKAVRAWAEANNVTKVWHEGSSVTFCDGAVSIKFHELCWEEIPKGEYTIAELCGEEKE